MDDEFTIGSPNDRHEELMGALRELLKDQQKLTVTMRKSFDGLNDELDRFNERTRSSIATDRRAISNLRHDHASVWEMYAALQQRMDRMDERIRKIEEKLEPPLPPFPEFKP